MGQFDFDALDEIFLRLHELEEDEINRAVEAYQVEERRLSEKRHRLHRAIDAARQEILNRLKQKRKAAPADLYEQLIKNLKDPYLRATAEILSQPESDIDTEKDISSLSFEELEDYYNQLRREESIVSYKRRIIQGKIDILKNALVFKHEELKSASNEEFAAKIAELLAKQGKGSA